MNMFATNWMRFGVTISVLVLLTETKFSDDGEIDNESLNTTKPSFRIVAPQVICKRKSGQNDVVELPKQITISMQTQGGQKLSYRVQMSFEVLGGFRGQQHSLSLWNCVRKLETKINVKNRELISTKNQINVNNTELTPGVFYIFKIVGIDAAGVESEPQNYTVTFSDGNLKRINADGSVIPDDISLSLLGAETTFADVDYIIEASVFFCSPQNDYLFKWTMSGGQVPAERSSFLRKPGALMRIPAGTFRAGEVHQIQASLLRANDSMVILYQSVSVKVVGRGHTITVTPELVSTGIGQPVEVSIIYRDSDNNGIEPKVKWSCNIAGDYLTNSTTEVVCDGFEGSSTLHQKAEFYSQGNYIIRASVTVGENTSDYHTMVDVQRDIIARPILGSVPFKAIAAGSEFRLEAIVDDLIPYCFCYWDVLNETGYAFFDQSTIPNGLGNITIVDIDGNFLSELVDYGNSTLSKDIQLLVPAKSDSFAGLIGDSQYKFRLNANCPAPITDLDEPDDNPRPNVTSYVDVIVSTNAPPVGRQLEITPQKGNALKTIFKFSTGVAKDVPTDYPLKYNFMVLIEQFVVSVGEFYENMVTTTVLPFSNEPIATMYEVCDSRSACATVTGPNLTVRKWPMTDKEFKIIVDRINASMWRLEFDNVYREALMTAVSLKQSNDQTHFADLLTNLEQFIPAQTERLHALIRNPSSESVFVTRTEVVNFVNHARQTLSVFGDPNEQIVQQLFNLLDLLGTDEDDDGRRRRKRSVITSTFTTSESSGSHGYDEIQTMLDLTETLLKSSNESVVRQAKTNLVQKVHQSMMKMCRRESSSPKTFEKTSVKFELRDMTAKQLKQANHSVPLTDSIMPASVRFNGMLLIGNRASSKFCVGKAMYPSDFLAFTDEAMPREIFELVVITLADGSTGPDGKKAMIPLVDVTGDRRFDVVVPFYSVIDSDRLLCQVWDGSSWNDSMCETIGVLGNYLKCKCSQIGFFRLSLNNNIFTLQELSTISSEEEITTKAISIITTPPSASSILTYTENSNNLTTNLEQSVVDVVTLAPVDESLAKPEITREQPTKQTTLTDPKLISPDLREFNEADKPEPREIEQSTQTAKPKTDVPTLQTIHVVQEQIPSPTADANTKPLQSSSTGYALAGAFLAVGAFIVTGLYVYHRRKQIKSSEQIVEHNGAELREPVAGIKYARFHDENTMRGDNIVTIFDRQSRF